MNALYNGGPAFPVMVEAHPQARAVGEKPKQHTGLSIRQMYAMHAPMPVPDWFKHEPDTPMPRVPDLNGTNASEHFAAKAALEAWRDQQRIAKFFAWRWLFADMMLATEAGRYTEQKDNDK